MLMTRLAQVEVSSYEECVFVLCVSVNHDHKLVYNIFINDTIKIDVKIHILKWGDAKIYGVTLSVLYIEFL